MRRRLDRRLRGHRDPDASRVRGGCGDDPRLHPGATRCPGDGPSRLGASAGAARRPVRRLRRADRAARCGGLRPLRRETRAACRPTAGEQARGCKVQKRWKVDPAVFLIAAGLVTLFLLWGVLFTDSLASVTESTLTWLLDRFGWLFVLSAAAFVAFAAYMGFSRYGTLRLGRDGDRPEFRTSSWIAMMFSAGMGIGLMFYAVAEPISHLGAPPLGLERAGTQEAARLSMQYTYFHWALTPWCLYGIVGLALGYFSLRKGMPNLISTAFHPLIGDRVNGPIGKSIDVFALWATLFGTAPSLGFGAAQINSGLNFLGDVPISNGLEVAVIGILTGLFVLSAVSGVEKGVQFLSNVNMVLAIVLALFVLLVGPFVFIWETFTESVGAYLYQFVPMSFRSGAFGGSEWLSRWTICYWAWWISWTPFVGTFLARISKGRTIREYLLGVLLVPTGVTL